MLDKLYELADNALLKVRPDLFEEWDFEKNDDLGLDIYKVTKGMGIKVWWNCPKCKSSYDNTINNRTNSGTGCPYCAGYRVNETNSLAILNPNLAKEWHPTLNGELTPHEVTCNKGKKVWWLGKCGHEWDAVIQSRHKGSECPYCDKASKRIKIGFNDMWTTNPEIASLLADPEDGYKYTEASNKKVDWKCPTCGEDIKNKLINNVYKRGLKCPQCSDGLSLGEKVIYTLLQSYNIHFVFDQSQIWSDNKRYDFFIPSKNTIIEVHGIQHYMHTGRGRSLKEEQENDKYKYELAIQNNVENYIVIECKKDEFNYIKNSIIKSEINVLLDLSTVEWNRIFINSVNSILIKTVELWNKNLTTKEITHITGICKRTIQKYLIKGNKLELCAYNTIDAKSKSMRSKKKRILQLDKQGNILNSFESAIEIHNKFGFNKRYIQYACRKDKGTDVAYGFRWRYE